MLTDLPPEDDQGDIACEGFGDCDFVTGEAAQAGGQTKSYRQADHDLSGNVMLARRGMFKPMLGRFNQDKSLPLRYCPIQIELELVNSQAGAVCLEVANGFSNGSNWDISGIQCKCDLLTLDTHLTMNMQVFLYQGNLCQSISILGIVRTNRLVTIRTSRLISQGL